MEFLACVLRAQVNMTIIILLHYPIKYLCVHQHSMIQMVDI